MQMSFVLGPEGSLTFIIIGLNAHNISHLHIADSLRTDDTFGAPRASLHAAFSVRSSRVSRL